MHGTITLPAAGAPVWTPSDADVAQSNLAQFVAGLRARVPALADLDVREYERLHAWSVAEPAACWAAVWAYADIVADTLAADTGDAGRAWDAVLVGGARMVPPTDPDGARWFVGARLNFAENLLRVRAGVADDAPALIAWGERGRSDVRSWGALRAEVAALAAALRADGVGAGDRVAAYLPNACKAVVAMLAAASVGAVWSSCSPDFGADGVVDRFGQIEPAVLFVSTGYEYTGKWHDTRPRVAEIAARLPSVRRLVAVGRAPDAPPNSALAADAFAADALAHATPWAAYLAPPGGPPPAYARLPFAHPLCVLYSSGTTGLPKGIVHSAGGTLLQHVKELALHTDLRAGDRLFYYTTLGWMMWNWQLSALALGCTLVLYDGNPTHPAPEVLWDMAAAERVAVFGTSARYLALLEQAGAAPRATHELGALRAVLSTGSPLAPESYDYVAERIKPGVRLSSISGGTDIVSCFALGAPTLPVWRGELQCLGLGMAVDVVDDDGRSLGAGVAGELACTRPFPSMPVAFWNDPNGVKYRAAYFEQIPGVWRHGDWAELVKHAAAHDAPGRSQRGLVIHGRSDATLNPGGVRIGTAELYRQAEQVEGVLEALAVEQQLGSGVERTSRLVLFVRLAEGAELTRALGAAIRTRIRERLTAHHVPRVIVAVPDLPRTRNGKLSELAARDAVHGREVKNTGALANPEVLAHFRDRPELRGA